MVPKRFTKFYFWNFVKQIIRLKDYLERNPDFDPRKYEDCKHLRIDGLGIEEHCTRDQDESLGEYILHYGGTIGYLALPLYKLSIFAATIYYANVMNEREERDDPIFDMLPDRAVDLVNKLYNCQATENTNVVVGFRRLCRRDEDQIDLILQTRYAEFPGTFPDDEFEDLTETLRTFFYASYIASEDLAFNQQ